jgi:hypothetical protein
MEADTEKTLTEDHLWIEGRYAVATCFDGSVYELEGSQRIDRFRFALVSDLRPTQAQEITVMPELAEEPR